MSTCRNVFSFFVVEVYASFTWLEQRENQADEGCFAGIGFARYGCGATW